MPPRAEPPSLPAAPPPDLRQCLRIGLLLLAALGLALSLQAVLLFHKERDLLTGITVSRIGLLAEQIHSSFQRASANGLQLGEFRALAARLPALAASAQDVTAIQVLDEDGRRLFATGPTDLPVPSPPRAARGLWHATAPLGYMWIGRTLQDSTGESVGSVLIAVRSAALDARIEAARAVAGPRLALTLGLVAVALPVLLVLAMRLPGPFSLRRRILGAALCLATAGSLHLSLAALPSFSERLAPALDDKAHALACFLSTRIDAALALGIPFERLNGVEAYFTDALAQHPEVLALRLQGPTHRYAASRPGEAGHALEVPISAGVRATGATLVTVTDAGVVARELRALAVDLAIVFLVALVLFNEALCAILGSARFAAGPRERLGPARLAVFLLILAEELTRAFLPVHIRALVAQTAAEDALTGPLVGLPISAYMASFALLTPFAGHWAVRFGVARTFALGAGLSAAGFLGAMAGGGYGAFVAARCLCAAGYAIGTLAIQQHFLSTATASERTRALALFVGAVQTAAICGSPVGGLLAERFGATAVFAAAAAMSGLAFLVQRLAVPVAPPAAGAPAPRLLPLLTRGRVVIPLLTAALPAKVVLAGFLFYLVPLALAGADYSPASTGRAMMLYFVLVAAANPLASWLSDRFGWQRSLVIAGGLVIGAGGVLGLLDRIETLFAGIVALGLGTGLSAAALQALASRDGPAAIVLLRTVERLGAVIGPLFVGSLLAVTAWGGAMATVGATMLVATLAFALWARAAASLDTPDKEPS